MALAAAGMRYRSKPSEIEAIQWTGDNLEEIEAFGVKFRYSTVLFDDGHPLRIKAGKGGVQDYVPCPVGHWVVRSVGDLTDHWPVEPVYFEGKYEPVG